MPKKLTIVSGIALILLSALIAALAMIANSGRDALPQPPERVSVLFPEENTIRIMPYNEFLKGCVRGLLPNGIEPSPEAVKAIAAAEHTRAMYHLSNKSPSEAYSADFSVSDDFPYTEQPSDEKSDSISAAYNVEELPLILYAGEPINAQMCKISTGSTDPSPPYSPSLPLLCDIGVKGSETSIAITYDNVRRALGYKVISPNFEEWFHDPVYAESGTLIYIGFCDTNITGAALRKALNLRSTAIRIEYREEKFYFYCKGVGENRGMSANAAIFLAQSGKSSKEILATFYPECTVSLPK